MTDRDREFGEMLQEYGKALHHLDHVVSHGLHCPGCDEAHTWLQYAGIMPDAEPSGTWQGSQIAAKARDAALEEAAAALLAPDVRDEVNSGRHAARIRALKTNTSPDRISSTESHANPRRGPDHER